MSDAGIPAADVGNDGDARLFDFAARLQEQGVEPWLMEMRGLRGIHFLHLDRSLAEWKKKVRENGQVSDADVVAIGGLLREQGS